MHPSRRRGLSAAKAGMRRLYAGIAYRAMTFVFRERRLTRRPQFDREFLARVA